jgi:hypothetical protein
MNGRSRGRTDLGWRLGVLVYSAMLCVRERKVRVLLGRALRDLGLECGNFAPRISPLFRPLASPVIHVDGRLSGLLAGE